MMTLPAVCVTLALAAASPRGIAVGSTYPAKHRCSRCGLCDTPLIAHVRDACAFIGEGFGRIDSLEAATHGRARELEEEQELYFGVHERIASARMRESVHGAAWTGVVTTIAARALESGMVDAVLAVGARSQQPYERLEPVPTLCRTADEVRACAGVKPILSPSLAPLDAVRHDPSIRRLLFVGVGCQVVPLRSVGAASLGLDELFVLGTNCADNVRSREALRTFLHAASDSPATAAGFEFTQHYEVHVRHAAGGGAQAGAGPRGAAGQADGELYERVPVFSVGASGLKEVIATSCHACFDYTNALADLVVGYMAAPPQRVRMETHTQYVVVRNARGRRLLELLGEDVALGELPTSGSRFGAARAVTEQDLDGLFLPSQGGGRGARAPPPLPRWLGTLLARALSAFGPRGLEFAKNSVDYHFLRNAVHARLLDGDARARERMPAHARRTLSQYGDLESELVARYRAVRPAAEAGGAPGWRMLRSPVRREE